MQTGLQQTAKSTDEEMPKVLPTSNRTDTRSFSIHHADRQRDIKRDRQIDRAGWIDTNVSEVSD